MKILKSIPESFFFAGRTWHRLMGPVRIRMVLMAFLSSGNLTRVKKEMPLEPREFFENVGEILGFFYETVMLQ